MAEDILTLIRGVVDAGLTEFRASIDLETSAIIVGTGGEQFASLVASGAISVPDSMNSKIGVTVRRLSCAVDKDCTTSGWLALIGVVEGDMAVVMVSEGDLL